MAEIDWVIHLCANGVPCEECGKVENGFLPQTCNAHTHGMEKYYHKDFQLVLALPVKEIARILNTMGLRVQAGERFHGGDLVSGIYEDCDIRLNEYEEIGRTVLRIIIPDKYNVFPEDERCMSVYRVQLLEIDSLYRQGGWNL